MSLNRITIIECGARRAALGTFAREAGALRCEQLLVEPIAFAGANDAEGARALLAALRALRRQAVAPGPVVVLPAPAQVLLKHVRVPRLEAAKLTQVIRFEVAQAIPYPLSEVSWDRVVSGERADGTDVLLLAAKHAAIEPLCDAIEQAGFSVRSVLPGALALFAAAREESAGEAGLAVQKSADTLTVLQWEGARFALRSLPWTEGDDAPTEIATRLVADVVRSTLYFQRQNGFAAPRGGWISAGAGLLPELKDRLTAKLQIPMAEFSPRMPAPAAAAREWGEMPQLAGAAGIHLGGDVGNVSLLPPHWRTRASWRRRKPWLGAAAVLAMGALLPGILHFHRLAEAARTESARLEASLPPLRLREARQRAALVRLSALQREVMTLQSLQARRTSWLRFLADLQERLVRVEDVWLERMQPLPPADGLAPRLALSGRMLERANPVAKAGPESFARVKALLGDLLNSPFVAAVEAERFDTSQPGVLRFDFVLLTQPTQPL